jgi:hypothetical protein
MKKTMKPLFIVCAAASLFFMSCKKDTVADDALTGTVVNAASAEGKAGAATGRSSSESEYVSAVLQISEDLFAASLQGQIILAEPSGDHAYKAYGSIGLDAPWYGGSTPTPRENCEAAAAAFALYVSLNQVAFQSEADNSGQNKVVSRQYPDCPTLFRYVFHPRNPQVCPECFTYTPYQNIEVEMVSE